MFFKFIYYIFIAAVIALGVLLIGTLFPIPGNYEVKIVQSGSMEPAIHTGSIVIIKPSSEYNVGDVITFGKDTNVDVPTTHRIIEERITSGEALYTTKGDANEDPDPKEVREQEIIGKVLTSIPYIGYVLDFARKPLGFALLIGVPAVVVILDELGNVWKEIARMRRRSSFAKASEDKEEEIT